MRFVLLLFLLLCPVLSEGLRAGDHNGAELKLVQEEEASQRSHRLRSAASVSRRVKLVPRDERPVHSGACPKERERAPAKLVSLDVTADFFD